MKKTFLSLVFVALSAMAFAQQWTSIGKSNPAGPDVKLISSSEQEVVVDFSLGGFYLTRVSTPNGTQMIVSVPKMATCLDAGAPNLPYFPVPAVIGDQAEMEVTVISSDYTDYQNVEVAPSKGNISRQINPDDVPYTYGEMYSQNAFYPAAQATLDDPYIIRDFRGQNIVVRPFAYNPVTKTLRVYHNMTIAIKKVSDNGENPKNARKAVTKVSPEMKAAYERRFINFGQTRYPFIEDRGELLVICADQFMPDMEEFVAWKNQSGRPTTMVSVTEAGGNNDNAIKSYITDLYNDPDRNLVFVLFVGDYEHITPHAVGAERSDNWFGQIEGGDHYDDILIGRFSVQTDAHVANHVNKVLYYERDMAPLRDLDWVNKGLGIGYIGAGSGHYGEDDYQHIDLIRDTLEHYTYEHVTELHGGGGGASTTSISNAINDGVSIINYCNHGSETSWGVANYSCSHVNALTNDYLWPVIWSVACLNGKFNYGGANGECFAESWMRATDNSTGAPTGAVGGMFSWMSQPWVPPMYGQDEMVDIFTEWRSTDLFNHTLGVASLCGNMNVIDKSGSSGYDTHDTWVLFGDPTLMMRSDIPSSMNINCNPSVLMLGMSSLEITAEDTPFGIATLTMDGEVISSGYIQDGTLNMEFAPMSNVGVATLTVIGYNKLTEIIQIEVLPAEGPYLTVSGYNPGFAPVNVETALSMSFKNVGVDPTAGVTTVSLSCDDERFTFIENTAEFDVLPAEETITLEDAFSFIVAEGVEDGTKFQVNVSMTCGDVVWTGKAYVTAGKAILDYVDTEWNGSYAPGEVLSLVSIFQNIGHYKATNAYATFNSESTYVTVPNEALPIGTIDPEGLALCMFDVVIDESCPETEHIPVVVTLQADGELIAEGTVILKNTCNVVFELSDSYGDGWNGNKLVVSYDDGTPQQQLTIENGNSATYVLEIGKGVHVTLSWITGSYTYECSFTVKYENGDIIYQSSNPPAGILHEFDVNCNEIPTGTTYFPVENLRAEVSLNAITLTWEASPDATNFIVFRNGLEIADITELTYVDELLNEDTYTYCVFAEYADGGFSLPACVVIQAEWGLDENDAEFAIYPNPTSGLLNISNGTAEFSYELYNGIGQRILSGTAQGNEQLNVASLVKGIYILRLTSGTQVSVQKVVVE